MFDVAGHPSLLPWSLGGSEPLGKDASKGREGTVPKGAPLATKGTRMHGFLVPESSPLVAESDCAASSKEMGTVPGSARKNVVPFQWPGDFSLWDGHEEGYLPPTHSHCCGHSYGCSNRRSDHVQQRMAILRFLSTTVVPLVELRWPPPTEFSADFSRRSPRHPHQGWCLCPP